ncbi:hypothetical protein [Pseudonocardia sp. WMMC193]|uniref:hypothetical protein n=1 Tax=Pseudonocardia sp. WMMC193 TaxID=2911965 RepID=UPI001F2F4502|nr:hypothetical protein [Pseudonocardia sp. WMMC193]MCF7550949.1 hypothetical protein [Pseudonocardia sp. WMMC193]
MSNVTSAPRPVTLTARAVTELRDYLRRADEVLVLPHNPDRLGQRHSILMAGYLRHQLDEDRP